MKKKIKDLSDLSKFEFEQKTIHIYYINRIKKCLGRIFEAEDSDMLEDDINIVNANNRAIQHWFKKAKIFDYHLQQEILSNVNWYDNSSAKTLENLGWTILKGKENL